MWGPVPHVGAEASPRDYGAVLLDRSPETARVTPLKRVLFSHWSHTVRFRCKVCHGALFEMRQSSRVINMAGMKGGKWCGRCHNGKVGFPLERCDDCHNYSEKLEAETGLFARLEGGLEDGEEEETNDGETEEAVASGGIGFMEYMRFMEMGEKKKVSSHDADETAAANPYSGRLERGEGAPHPQKAPPFASLPKDDMGLIDWEKSVKEGTISPRATLESGGRERFETDPVLLSAKSDFVEDVLFRHDSHSYWIDCGSCHEKIYRSVKGKTALFMSDLADGKGCGVCHGTVAFPLDACTRCHREP